MTLFPSAKRLCNVYMTACSLLERDEKQSAKINPENINTRQPMKVARVCESTMGGVDFLKVHLLREIDVRKLAQGPQETLRRDFLCFSGIVPHSHNHPCWINGIFILPSVTSRQLSFSTRVSCPVTSFCLSFSLCKMELMMSVSSS